MAAIVLAQVGQMVGMLAYESIVGAAAITSTGATIAGAIGSAIGSTVGGAIDRALFGSGGESVYGPRLSDLSVQSSTDGAPLPLLFGTARLAGNVIWSTGLEESAHTEEAGGGSGGGGASITTYTYKTDVAIALCEGEITGIRRIWADSKLIYDVGDDADAETLVASSERAAAIRVYAGSETQEPDPLIQAIEGAANAPAYRGTAYILFEDLQLADFGNRLPNFQFEVTRTGSAPTVFTDYTQQNTYTYETGGDARWQPVMIDRDGVHVIDINQGTGGSTTWTHWLHLHNGAAPVLIEHRTLTIPWSAGPVPKRTTTDEVGVCIVTSSPTALYYIGYADGDFVETLIGSSTADGLTAAMAKTGTHLAHFVAYGSAYYVVLDGRRLEYDYSTGATKPILRFTDNYLHVHFQDNSAASGGASRYDRETGDLVDHIAPSVFSSPGVDRCVALDDDRVLIRKYADSSYKTIRYDDFTEVRFADDALEHAGSGMLAIALLADARLFVLAGAQTSTGDGTCVAQWYSLGITAGTDTLQHVAETLCARAGLDAADYDMSALAGDTVRGYVVGRPMTMRAAMEPLMSAYHFDLAEIDGEIVAVKRGGAADATLTADDLGAAENPDGTTLALTRNHDAELPSELHITYSDVDNDYQPATQYARRLTATHENVATLSMSLAMNSQEATRLADILLNVAWYSGRHALSWGCTYEQARLTPADVVSVPGYGRDWSARITQVDLGAPGLVLCQAVPDLPALYSSQAVGADATGIAQALGLGGPTNAQYLDCMMLRDEDTGPGWYLALAGYLSAWPGAVVFKSDDGGATWVPASEAGANSAATMGYATTVLASHGCTVWDRTGTVTVRLTSGSVSSTTEAAVLNGSNAALLGAHGRWELIQFATATLNGDGTYTLSNLLRGRKGTDYAAASHALYDRFILLNTALKDVPLSTSEIGAARHYKTVTAGRAIEEVGQESKTYTGERLKCLSPVDLRASRDGSGNITLTWKRRDRINAGWHDFSDIPMSESSEAYEVDIYTDSTYATVKRTLSGLASATASYTSAQQVTDFGANQATVYARAYQLSASVGRGHYRQGAV